jgi:tRNA threonylcarbamoyladenosine biosynthesis protein TsaB
MTVTNPNNSLLVIDAASFNAGIGIRRTDRAAFSRIFQGGIRAEALASEVKGLLQDADLMATEIRFIAVNCGPGSFTGIRTGMAFAKGLAAGIPDARILPISATYAARSALKIDIEGAIMIQVAAQSFVRQMAPGPGLMIEDAVEADRLSQVLADIVNDLNRPLAIERGIAPELENHPNVTTFANLTSLLLDLDVVFSSSIAGNELRYLEKRF